MTESTEQLANEKVEAEQPIEEVQFALYRRKNYCEMTPWTPEFDMKWVNVSRVDTVAGSPKDGDMIARKLDNHLDTWLVSQDYFNACFEPVETEESE